MKRYILLIALLSLSAVYVGECAPLEPNSLYGLRLGDSMSAVRAEADKQRWSFVGDIIGSSPHLITWEFRDKRNRVYTAFSNDRLYRITLYLEDNHPSEPMFNVFLKDLADEYGKPQIITYDTSYEWHIGRVSILLSRYSDSDLEKYGLSQTCELELQINQPVEYNLRYF